MAQPAVAAPPHEEHRLQEAYGREGWVALPRLVPEPAREAALSWLRQKCARREVDPFLQPQMETSPDGRRAVRKLRRLLWADPEFWVPLVAATRVPAVARALVGPHATLVRHAAFLKPGKVGSPVGFHQDQVLWEHDYPGAASIWVALTPAADWNGCLQLVPGSHRVGARPHIRTADYPWHPVILPGELGGGVVEMPAQPGDGAAWDRFMVHGSGANGSASDRVGMVFVFADSTSPGFTSEDKHEFH